MSQVIDPVAAPDTYRAFLLDALGDDDPAVVQAATPAAVEELVAEAGDLVRVRPLPAEWSVLECLGHLADAELVVATRYRWIIAENEPEIVGYDQALWVDGLRHNEDDPPALAALFGVLRRSNLDLWARRAVADRDRVGLHNERGRESYGLTFRLAAGHDRIHLAQARETLAAVRAARG